MLVVAKKFVKLFFLQLHFLIMKKFIIFHISLLKNTPVMCDCYFSNNNFCDFRSKFDLLNYNFYDFFLN